MVHRLIPPDSRKFSRGMRADATKAENILWQALRNRQLEGLKFKRQVPLGGYVLDFVCFEARLIIEVDDGQHSEWRRMSSAMAISRVKVSGRYASGTMR